MSITNHAVIGRGVEIRPSSIPDSGNGLWTCRPFLKHDLITEYCGPLIDHEKACKLRRQGKHTHVRVLNSQWLYINGLKEPTPGAGGASFANDARDSTVNNAAFIQKFDYKLGRDRVFIKACRDIDAGEEVFVSYGSTYWRNSRISATSASASQHNQQNEQCQRRSSYVDMQEPMVQQQQRQVQSRQQISEPSSIHSSQTDIDLPELAPPAVHDSRATRGLVRQAAQQVSRQQQQQRRQQQQTLQHRMQPLPSSNMQSEPRSSILDKLGNGVSFSSQPVANNHRTRAAARSQQPKHNTAAAAAAEATTASADQPETAHSCDDQLGVTRSWSGSRKRTGIRAGLQDLHGKASRTKKSGCVGSQVCSNTHSMASSGQQLPPPGDAALAASRVVNFMSGGLRQAVGNAAAAVGGAAIAVASRVGVARQAPRLC